MTDRMVEIRNMVRGNISIKKPEYGINLKWSTFNQPRKIPFSLLEQAIWDAGIRNMFESGILYIDNLQDKIDLGLEPADAVEPVNIIQLDVTKMENYWKNIPFPVFKKEVSNLTKVQVDSLISYAITNKIVDMEKCEWLKELTGKDILKSISQRAEMEEADKKRKEQEKRNQIDIR